MIPIVFACDDRYIEPLSVAIASIQENSGSHEMYVIADNIKNENKALIDSRWDVKWIDLSLDTFNKYSRLARLTRATFGKLLLPEVLPLLDVLYLDVDVLVLGSLADVPIASQHQTPLMAVHDAGEIFKSKAWLEGKPIAANIPRVKQYFNAGMLSINLERWRELDVTTRGIEYLNSNRRTLFSDQDALNYVFDEQWTPIDESWNWQHHKTKNVDSSVKIVHYVGESKPWKSTHPHFHLYSKYKKRAISSINRIV